LKRYFRNLIKSRQGLNHSPPLGRLEAIKMMEISYLAATTALIWICLYYLPIGGAFFRLALPLPLAFLEVRRGSKSSLEAVLLMVLLLLVLMGPVRGPLVLFPYGLLSIWLGSSWRKGLSWWISWSGGVVVGVIGFLFRVLVLSLLVGENLWVIITRAGSGLLEKLLGILNLPVMPDLLQVQIMAIALVIVQEIIYVFALHAIAFWVFPRLKARIPSPPRLLNSLVAMDPL